MFVFLFSRVRLADKLGGSVVQDAYYMWLNRKWHKGQKAYVFHVIFIVIFDTTFLF